MKIEVPRSFGYIQWETAENQYVLPSISSLSLCLDLPPYPEIQNSSWNLRNGVQVRLDGDEENPEESQLVHFQVQGITESDHLNEALPTWTGVFHPSW